VTTIVLSDPEPAWPDVFRAEASRLRSAPREVGDIDDIDDYRQPIDTVNDFAISESAWIGPATERAEAWAAATDWSNPEPLG
jgi:hypothetical protein